MEFDKKLFISMFFNAYVDKYMNCNLQCHTEFCNTLKEMSTTKKPELIMKKYEYMKQILMNNEFIIPDIGNITFSKRDIERIINIYTEEYTILSSVKDILSQEAYAILNYVYGCLVTKGNTDNVLTCIAYLVSLNKKELLCKKQYTGATTGATTGASNVSIIDILFNILIYYAKQADKDLYRYVSLSRYIMYFKSNKKSLKERLRVLYITIYVILNDALDKSVIKKKNHNTICDYLYVICEKDYKTMVEIQKAAELLRLRKQDPKKVKVDKYPEEVDMNIVKREYNII